MTNPTSESLLDRFSQAFFQQRWLFLILFAIATVFFIYRASLLEVGASLIKTLPFKHEFYTELQEQIRPRLGPSQANAASTLRIVVEHKNGDIYAADYLKTLEKIHETLFFLPGVDRAGLLSLPSPTPQWIRLTVDGVENGVVWPHGFDGSQQHIDQLRQNIIDSPYSRQLVALDHHSSAIILPLLSHNPETGEEIDAVNFSQMLEQQVRQAYNSGSIDIKIVGQVKIMGDIIAAAEGVMAFFLLAFVVIGLLIYWYCKDMASTLILLTCASVAVIWQLGIVELLGGGIDPYTLLRPFLIFAISVSHGVQMINAVGLERICGHNGIKSAVHSFRALIIPGSLALVSDALGFLVMLQIQIPIIIELAIGAAAGVMVILLINMLLLPCLLSLVDTRKGVEKRLQKFEQGTDRLAQWGSYLANRKVSLISLSVGIALYVFGVIYGQQVQLGDFEPGAAELHQDSRYNQDQSYIDAHYPTGIDELLIFVTTLEDYASSTEVVHAIDRLEWLLNNIDGVDATQSTASYARYKLTHFYDLNWKWYELPDEDVAIKEVARLFPGNSPGLDLTTIKVTLTDHRDDTMQRVVDAVQTYAGDFNNDRFQFRLGHGSVAKDYATNRVIEDAQAPMLIMVHAIVILLCGLTFRSWRAAVCIVAPLALTTTLAHALMAGLGIGLKLATLPIVALGVGIGVDYGIYIYGRFRLFLQQGLSVQHAYYQTLRVTGKAVAFAGLTLSIGVSTWLFSALKFQADMGLMLTFMFLFNMIGALTLLPGIAAWLHKDTEQSAGDNSELSLIELLKIH